MLQLAGFSSGNSVVVVFTSISQWFSDTLISGFPWLSFSLKWQIHSGSAVPSTCWSILAMLQQEERLPFSAWMAWASAVTTASRSVSLMQLRSFGDKLEGPITPQIKHICWSNISQRAAIWGREPCQTPGVWVWVEGWFLRLERAQLFSVRSTVTFCVVALPCVTWREAEMELWQDWLLYYLWTSPFMSCSSPAKSRSIM